LNHFAGEITSP